MRKRVLILLLLSFSTLLFGAERITGLWRSIDDQTGLSKSITIIYEYEGKIYGRILATYDDYGVMLDSIMNPSKKAENVKGAPYFSGLDFIWAMEDRGRKWSRGKIMDPEPGKIYSCDIWKKDANLIVRGKVGPFGRNQTWVPVVKSQDLPEGFVVPENLVPVIPEPKKK